MAILKYSPVVASLSGKLGGGTFKNTGGRNTLSGSGKPKRSASQFQARNRTFNQTVTQLWRELSDSQRLLYNSFVRSQNPVNIITGSPFLSGFALFYSMNYQLFLYANDTFIPNPYQTLEAYPSQAPLAIINDSPALLSIRFPTLAPAFSALVSIFGSKPTPSYRFPRPGEFRFLKAFIADSVSTYSLTSEYLAAFGTLPSNDQFIQLRVILSNPLNGLVFQEVIIEPEDALLMDLLSVVPTGLWSVRQDSNTYSGSAIEVRRSSDNAIQNFGFVDGWIDSASIATFAGGSDTFVKTLYDVSGNANDLTQATNGLQPQLFLSGGLNNRPYISSVNGTRYFNKTTSPSPAAGFSVWSIYKFTSTPAGSDIATLYSSGTGVNRVYCFFSTAVNYRYISMVAKPSTNNFNVGSSLNILNANWHNLLQRYNGGAYNVTGSYNYNQDSVNLALSVNNDGYGTASQTIFSNAGAFPFKGYLSEMIEFDSNISDSDRDILQAFATIF